MPRKKTKRKSFDRRRKTKRDRGIFLRKRKKSLRPQRIKRIEFGSVTIGDKKYKHDVIITWEGKVKRLDMEKHHRISNGEFFTMLFQRTDTIIIGTGFEGNVKIYKRILNFAKKKKIKVIANQTPTAARKFNELFRKKKVVAFLHLSC